MPTKSVRLLHPRGFYTFNVYDPKKKTGETLQVALSELSPSIAADRSDGEDRTKRDQEHILKH